jgi:endonuclease/exonuclease/phosphatase family metal-dependent hydrolase
MLDVLPDLIKLRADQSIYQFVSRFFKDERLHSARFVDRTTGDLFVAATVHILYGDGISDRTPEINELGSYWGWLQQTYDNTPVLLMGDFNLAPTHRAWTALTDQGLRLL